jgi:GT2 family glycosyltransferase
MQPRVTVILVARTGAAYLERTLSAIAGQSRKPDTLIAVDAASTDNTAEILAESGAATVVSVTGKASFGDAVARAIQLAAPQESENEWLWLLGHDNAPLPDALEQLLAAVEIAPSVVVAGPKLMRWDTPDVIADFGESMTKFGTTISMVQGELDQAQHDVRTDVLGVATGGMLVRRSLWTALGGFDHGLPSIDAGLDLSIRARLAGYRVALVPAAKVASLGGPELFGRRTVSDGRRTRIARGAQLHRRLVYAGPLALIIHWLSLLPLAIIRAAGQLLAKRPGAVAGEFSTAIGTAFGASHVGAARRSLRRTRKLGWAAIAPLRLPWSEVRERRAQAREAAINAELSTAEREPRAGFIANGGLWLVGGLLALGVIVCGPLLGASAITGGGLLPLSDGPAELWANVGYGADPFTFVLAILGSLTFWSPSLSIVIVYVIALPVAGLGAWYFARRISRRPWVPIIAALLWALAPPLLGSMVTGHLGATIAHLLLPWLALLAIRANRSWVSAAGTALLFAAVTASAPSLAPALLLCWIVLLVTQPKNIHRLIGIPVLAAALFAPLVVLQVSRGNALALLADPGVPTAGATTSGWQLMIGAPGGGLQGWQTVFDGFSRQLVNPEFFVAVLFAPLAILAVLSLFVPGSRRAIPSMALALLGFVTAVVVSHLSVAHAGAATVAVWPGAALSLFWLGLIGGAIVALEAMRQIAVPYAVVVSVTSVAMVLPLLGAFYPSPGTSSPEALSPGASPVSASDGRILPAFVTVEAATNPSLGTLVLAPQSGNSISAVVQRGPGTTLDEEKTLAATSTSIGSTDDRLATLAGNLSSRSGYSAKKDLGDLGISFVLLTAPQGNDAVHQRIEEALDGNALLTPIGETDGGQLWRYQPSGNQAFAGPATTVSSPLGVAILFGQGLIAIITVLLGIPTARRRRRHERGDSLQGPATTFDEDTDG